MDTTKLAAPETAVNKSMHILELRAQNVKRLTAVRIKTDGQSVVIAGENEAGKSSVLDAIEMALRGKPAMPVQPIRDGEDAGSVRLDLGDVIVTRTITPDGRGSLKVENRDGLTYPSPQAFLDGLFGKRSLDPLAFVEQDDDQQAITLRRLARIDTTDLDLEYKKLYDERTLVNREVKQAQGALASASHYPELDGAEITSSASVTAKLEHATTLERAASKAQNAVELATMRVNGAEATARSANELIARLKAQLEEAELQSIEADELLRRSKEELETATRLAATAKAQVPDRSGIEQELNQLEATNSKIRANQQHKALADQFATKEAEAKKLTERLNGIEVEKADMLANAQFPIKGLGLNSTGVTWNGLPFSQASMAIRIRVSVAIALALHPQLNVLLVRNGNDLGAKNLHLLAQAAEEAGAQLWIERIAGGEGLPTVVIEDGTVAAATREVAHA